MGKALIIPGADFSANGIQPEYTRLAWIGAANSSANRINSGLFFGNKTGELDDEIEFSVSLDATKLNSGTTSCYSPGCGVNSYTNIKAWFTQSQTTVFFSGYNDGSAKEVKIAFTGSLFDGSPHTIKINRYGGVVDGESKTFSNSPNLDGIAESVYNNIPVYLDCNTAVDSDSQDAEKIHWVKYRRNGVLILDAIPVRRNSDGKIGFYDLVNDEYHFRNNDSVPVYGL